MKKILSIILLMFLISGCSVNYEIKIGGETMKENTAIISNQKKSEEINKAMTTYTNVFYYDGFDPYENNQKLNYKYYNKSIINDGYGIKLNYIFDPEKYSGSSIANYCFDNFFFGKSGDEFYLDTREGKFTCFEKYSELKEVTIKIIVDTLVYENNADSINGNEYTWSFNRNNASNASIYMYFIEPDYNISEEINVIDPNQDNPSSSDNISSSNDEYSSSSDNISSSNDEYSSSKDNNSSINSTSSNKINENDSNTENNNLLYLSIVGIVAILSLIIVLIIIKYRRSKKL